MRLLSVPGNFGRSALAGLTLAAVTIPEQMATAKLGGFAPQIGLFAFVAATIGFIAFGRSRVLTVGADTTIMPIFAGALASLGAANAGPDLSASVTLAALVGVLLCAAGALRLGFIANLLSVPVVAGFLLGIAVHILGSQLPVLMAVDVAGTSLPERLWNCVRDLPQANLYSVAIGLGVLGAILLAERADARLPGALIGLAIVALLSNLFGLQAAGVSMMAPVSAGLPVLAFPSLALAATLVPLALLVTLVVIMQVSAVDRSFAQPDGGPDVNRDFIGLGAANVAAGLVGAFPVNASPPRTAVIVEAGGASQLSAAFAVVAVVAFVLWGGSLMTYVPESAFAGILLFVALRIVRVGELINVARRAPAEAALAFLTALAIIVLPIQTGIAIGVGAALLHGVWMTMQTSVVELGRVRDTTIWWPPAGGGKPNAAPGVLVLGFQAPLLFANASVFRQGMEAAIRNRAPGLKLVVLEGSGISDIDYTAGEAIGQVVGACRDAGAHFAIARLESERSLAALHRLGLIDLIGEAAVFRSVDEALQAFNGETKAPI